MQAVLALAERNKQLESFVGGALMHSLLQIRRAAFGPEIGVRYTEKIRSEICNECWALEVACKEILRG